MSRIIILFLILVSCSTVRHYKKVATDTRVTTEKKAIIAPFVSTYFPVRERVKSDTVKVTDTLYDEGTAHMLSDIIDSLLAKPQKKDTALIRKFQELKKKCASLVSTTITIRDTIYTVDEAERFTLTQYVKATEAENSVLKKEKELADKRLADMRKQKSWLIVSLVLAGLIIAALLYFFLRFK